MAIADDTLGIVAIKTVVYQATDGTTFKTLPEAIRYEVIGKVQEYLEKSENYNISRNAGEIADFLVENWNELAVLLTRLEAISE